MNTFTVISIFIKENSGLAVVLKSYEITQNLGAKSRIDLISRLNYGIVYLTLIKQRLFLIITIARGNKFSQLKSFEPSLLYSFQA